MSTYLATDSVGAPFAVTTPLGADSPAEIDDAIREVKLVLRTVIRNACTDKGALRMAIWKHVATAGVASAAAAVWQRRALATIVDPTSLLGAGTYTSSIKPIAGKYLVNFWGFGYQINRFQTRFAEATGNTTSPSAATEIADMLGLYTNANTANSSGVSHGSGILTADGIKSYCLDQQHETANATDGYGRGSAPGTGAANVVACVTFHFLGIVAP